MMKQLLTALFVFGNIFSVHGLDFGNMISVLDYGAVANNSADCSSAFQSAIDALAARGEGGELFIPDGKYAIRSPVYLKPKVSIFAGKSAYIRAASNMTAMISSYTGSTNRLVRQSIRGGVWNGASNADRIFYLRDFNTVSIKDAVLYDAQVAYIDVDGTGACTTCYELLLTDLKIERTAGAGSYPSGCVGIRAGAGVCGVSDSHFSDVIISGVERGLSGGFYVSKFDRVHVFGYGPTQGQVYSGFYMQGGNNQFVQCQVDNPKYEGWYIDEDGSQVCHSCITFGADGDWLEDGEAVCVYIETGHDAVVENNRWNVQSSSYRMAAEFDGDPSGLRAGGNMIRGGNMILPYGDAGPGALEAYVDFSTVSGSAPTINKNINVASVTRTSDADYTIVFSRDMPNTGYVVNINMIPTSYPADMIWVLRDKATGSVRVQFKDNGSFVRPEQVTLQCFGGAF